MSDETVTIEMERFRGKARNRETGELASVSYQRIDLLKGAMELSDKTDCPYVNFYVSKDKKKLGMEPVGGSEVDGDSYKFRNGSVTPELVLRELDVDLEWKSNYYAVRWDSEREMWMIDFTEER